MDTTLWVVKCAGRAGGLRGRGGTPARLSAARRLRWCWRRRPGDFARRGRVSLPVR